MNSDKLADETYWLSVIAKSLAYLSLHQADLRKEEIAVQAQFLVGLGLNNEDAANVIGTTKATVQVALSKAKSKKRKGNAKGKK